MEMYDILLAKALGGGSGGGGGGSGWELIATQEFEVSTTASSQTNVGSISVADKKDIIYDKNKLVVVIVKDKNEVENGCFYGSVSFAMNINTANNTKTSPLSGGNWYTFAIRKENGYFTEYSGKYGVFCTYLDAYNTTNNVAIITSAYNSSRSGTINGTYVVDIYAVDYPDPFF